MQTIPRYILFDLDGTLTDSGPGIRNGVRYTLRRYGIEEPDDEKLNRFIGPPLPDSFRRFYGIDEPDDLVLENCFREYYSEKGIYENTVYEGIPDCLKTLREQGLSLYLATSKPQFMAERVLAHFKLTDSFNGLCGAARDLKLSSKAAVIRQLLKQCPEIDPAFAVMVGDRNYDVLGAAQLSMECVGVLWGYGSREELEKAGAAALVRTPEELTALLCRL